MERVQMGLIFTEKNEEILMSEEFLIKRTKRKDNFTIINNEILTNKVMSFGAKGLLCYILHLPDDWILYKSQIIKEFEIGRDRLNTYLSEIEQAGYLCTVEKVAERGRFGCISYLFYDESIKKLPPHTEKQHGDLPCSFPVTGLPYTEKPHLLSTNSTPSTKETKNYITRIRKKPAFVPPTVDEVREYFKTNGYSDVSAVKAFEYYNVADWKDRDGKQVRNWKQKMQGVWFKPENKQQPKSKFTFPV